MAALSSSWVLWANNLHTLNRGIKETSTGGNRTDSKSTTFGMKRITKIEIWNVRTLSESGRLQQAVVCMKSYGLNIFGMSEVRWSKFGEVIFQDGATFLYSGRPEGENVSREGVDILMDKEAKRSLIEWHPVSARIIVARFKTTIKNIAMIQCYAPTAVAEDMERQEFYVQLNDTLKKQKKKDITIVGGDLNAKVGQDNEGLEHVMGRHGLGERNENGQLFVDFCAGHDLVIGGTIFPHKDCHKVTWVSPDHKTENQIDHVAIGRKWRRSLLDMRSKRGADIGSDHHLVVAKFKMKIQANSQRTRQLRKRYDISKLKEDMKARELFKIELKNRFQILTDMVNIENKSVEETWRKTRTTFVETNENVLGFKERNKKDWMTQQIWEKIRERKNVKRGNECM